MEETHEGARARRALRTHIGALYSCPTNVPVPRVREDNLRELSLKRPDGSTYCFERLRYTPYSSARCLVRQAPVQSSSNCCASSGSGEPPTNEYPAPSNDYAPAKADDASIIEVFCRVLPLRTLPAHTLALSGSGRNLVPAFAPASPRHGTGGADERNANTDALLESLGTMYKGLQVVGSPPQASIAAGPGTTCEDGDESVGSSAAAATAAADAAGTTAVSSVAAQPVGLARPLATCARLHAGLVPLFAPVVESRDDVFLLFACVPFRLTALTQLCRAVRGATGGGWRNRNSVDLAVRFVFYQLLRVVDYIHSRGIAIGNLSSSNVLLTDHLWVQIAPSVPPVCVSGDAPRTRRTLSPSSSSRRSLSRSPLRRGGFSTRNIVGREEISEKEKKRRWRRQQKHERPGGRLLGGSPRPPPGEDLPLTYRWVKGMVTNLEYLLAVNTAAGRFLGDRSCHPIVPWVSDLSCRLEGAGSGGGDGEGWRDLTMTKFRLKKGDVQLDKSYSEGKPPHHIPESLSELTLSVYLARQLPLQVLRDVVRSELVAEEYPASIARMYGWTPDECVPEFYTDPAVFRSTHSDAGGLSDLEVPSWFEASPEDFVRYHRSLLESERVTRNLHRWLDITFGYCLKGQAAVDNKNVPLPRGGMGPDAGQRPRRWNAGAGLTLSREDRSGFVQIFRHPHPPRKFSERSEEPSDVGTSREAYPEANVDTTSETASVMETLELSATVDSTEAAATAASLGIGTEPGPPRLGNRSVSASSGRGQSVEGGGGRGGGASIFGVAFDDYIGEEGVRTPFWSKEKRASEDGARIERAKSDGATAGETQASIEEERRALAFAYDVELRLDPWYGRARTSHNAKGLSVADSTSDAATDSSASVSTIRCDDGDGDGDCIRSSDPPTSRKREILPARGSPEAADLLACGCILSELCAGEPVLAVPAGASERTSGSGGGGRADWLESAVELPPALRSAIGALTHPDPSQRPSALELLSTTEPTQNRATQRDRAGRSDAAPPPSYGELFPPYMHDVYAFLAALQQEETAQKRLLLAAAALPVLEVPIHAFSLVVPHLVTLLGSPQPTEEACCNGKPAAKARRTGETGRAGRSNAVQRKTVDPQGETRGGDGRGSEGKEPESANMALGQPPPTPSPPPSPPPISATESVTPPKAVPASSSLESASQSSSQGGNDETASEKKCVAGSAVAVAVEAVKHAQAWVAVFDFAAARLGPGLASDILLPPALTALEGIRSPGYACHLMDSHLWGVLAQRVGTEPFLRHALPLLLAWLERGVDDNVFGDASETRGRNFPAREGGYAARKRDDAANGSVERARNSSLEGGVLGEREEAERVEVAAEAELDSASSRVQVAAAASVSSEVYECLGPPLAARYLIPALVDCLGRLSIASASNPHPPALAQTPGLSRAPPSVPALNATASATPLNDHDPPTRGVTDARERDERLQDDCAGDPASRALFHYCSNRDGTAGDPDLGIGKGESFLVLSRALGEMCLQIDTEEVTVPLVLSRLFHQIIPSLAPALVGKTGAPVSATMFRSVLEITSLLGRVLPTLCPEIISHFYVGMRPAWAPPSVPSSVGGNMACSEVTSVPWLLSAMPLPEPVGGLDMPWSADQALTGGDALAVDPAAFLGDGGESEVLLWSAEDDAGVGGSLSDTEKARSPRVVGDSPILDRAVPPWTPEDGGNPRGMFVGDEDEDGFGYGQYCPSSPGVSSTVGLKEALAVTSLGSPSSPAAASLGSPCSPPFSSSVTLRKSDVSSATDLRGYAEDGCVGADARINVSLQFVCHIEAARLLAATAMGVLGEEGSGEEEYGPIFQAAEDFFSAFRRSYGGLLFSSPTMVAALKLAREVYNPLASLFGFDAMRERVPSASRRIVAWLSRDLTLPRNNTQRPIVPWEGVATSEETARLFRGRLGSGDAVVVRRPHGSFSEAHVTLENESESRSKNGSPAPAEAETGGHWRSSSLEAVATDSAMYISPGESPEREDSLDSNSAETATNGKISDVAATPEPPSRARPGKENEGNGDIPGEGEGEGAPVLLMGRLQQAIKQRLTPERSDGSAASTTTKDSADMLHSERLESSGTRADRHRQREKKSRTRTPRGLPAWGKQSQDGPDSLLPPPSSALPPPLSHDSGVTGSGATKGQRVEAPPRGGSGGPDYTYGVDQSLGIGVPTPAVAGQPGNADGNLDKDAAGLEWPSLLGAMGAKAPTVKKPHRRSRSVRDLPTSNTPAPAPAPSPLEFAGTAWIDDEFARVQQEVANASAATVTTKAQKNEPPNSPPVSPFLRSLPTSLTSLVQLPPLSSPPPPPTTKPRTTPFSPPPPLPGMCRGEGVEVAERLRERGWLTGTRVWGESRESAEQGQARVLGDGFDADAVGSLFPLEMALQTSFLAHPDKAPVTSMTVDTRSESVLMTGSGEGEVRVWSLSDHPVTRLSGFRAGGDNGGSSGSEAGGGGRKGSNSSRQSRTAITQLGIFEGAGRAAALDGLVRVWDVERSKGLAICHQGTTTDAQPLTSFSLSGCGDGTTPPLDASEWEDLAAIGSDTSAFTAADDQQLSATYSGGVVHFDCRQSRLGGTVRSLFPVAHWDVEARLQSLRARVTNKSQTRSGDPPSLHFGLCSVCEGEGSWLAAGSGGGQVVVFDKRRPGGRPLFWWNAHSGAVVGVFHVARHYLLTTSRDRTAVLWDLSRSPAELSGVDSTGPMPRHPGWGLGAYSEESPLSSLGGRAETAPVRVSALHGLPDNAPGMFPATVRMLPLSRPPPPSKDGASYNSMFGEGWARRGRWRGTRDEVMKFPVIFAAAGDSMVASVVHHDPTGEEAEVHPMRFVGPSGKAVNGGRRSGSGGGLVVRSVAVLPLRRLSLLGCADGWVRVGT